MEIFHTAPRKCGAPSVRWKFAMTDAAHHSDGKCQIDSHDPRVLASRRGPKPRLTATACFRYISITTPNAAGETLVKALVRYASRTARSGALGDPKQIMRQEGRPTLVELICG